MSRSSSITNAFFNAIVPVVYPSTEEVREALAVLEMTPEDVRCSYCGDPATEWDHLRPIIRNRRPTGFASELANLVPACGKCNQSKGSREWETWITSSAKLSPASREVADIDLRIERLRKYEARWKARRYDFEKLAGAALWEQHRRNLEELLAEMRRCQAHALEVREAIKRGATVA
jgi:hypothetical protein